MVVKVFFDCDWRGVGRLTQGRLLRITLGGFYEVPVRCHLEFTNVVLIELLRRADSTRGAVGSHNGMCSKLEPQTSTELLEINILFT